jgi:hypothetical protein
LGRGEGERGSEQAFERTGFVGPFVQPTNLNNLSAVEREQLHRLLKVVLA